jgi:hypothetical protein
MDFTKPLEIFLDSTKNPNKFMDNPWICTSSDLSMNVYLKLPIVGVCIDISQYKLYIIDADDTFFMLMINLYNCVQHRIFVPNQQFCRN